MSASWSKKPKCSAQSLFAVNSLADTRPSLSVSCFSRMVSKGGSHGSVDPVVAMKRVSPLETTVPIAPFEPIGSHQRCCPVSTA